MRFCNGYLCHQSNIPGLFSLMICCFLWPCVRAGHLLFFRLVFWSACILFFTKDCWCSFFLFCFINKDCYCSCAHFPVFWVCSSLNCSNKKTAVLCWKRELKHSIAHKTTVVFFLPKFAPFRPATPPPRVNEICMYRVKELAWWGGVRGDGPPPPRLVSFFQTVQEDTTLNMCQSCIWMRFQTIVIVLSLYLVFELLCSLLLISLMSALLRICFCQFAQSASLFVSRSAIAPKVKVHSWAKRERVISKSNVPSSAFC